MSRRYSHRPIIVETDTDNAHDMVLGAGGEKGYAQIGVLRSIQKHKIRVRKVRGVSVGAANATLVANGRTPDQILEHYEHERGNIFDAAALQHITSSVMAAWGEVFAGKGFDPLMMLSADLQRRMKETTEFWGRAFTMPDAVQWDISPSFISLEGLWKHLCEREKLEPKDCLEIVAFCRTMGKLVTFKGTNYPLYKAVAASGSLSPIFSPVKLGEHNMVDGAEGHYNPADDLPGPAIVVRLGRAKRWPRENISPMDAWFLWHELYSPFASGSQEVDTEKHILVHVPCDDVAGLAFGTSYDRRMALVKLGEEVADQVFAKELEAGRIITD